MRHFSFPHESGRHPEIKQENIDKVLLMDSEKHHFKRFFRRFREFQERFASYEESGVREAELIAHDILLKSQLASADGFIVQRDKNGINAEMLSVWVLNWRLGIALTPVYRAPDGLHISLDGIEVVKAESKEEIGRVHEILDELCANKETVESFRYRGKVLATEGGQILEELETLVASSALPGRCRLSKA
jgi:hypothetical protein